MKVKNVNFKELFTSWRTAEYSCSFSIVVKTTAPIEAKFKIIHDTGNCYSRTDVYKMTPNGTWEHVADADDLSSRHINYVVDEDVKDDMMRTIYKEALEYIVYVWMS